MPQNLNHHRYESFPFIEEDGTESILRLRDYALNEEPASVSLRFFNLTEALVERINKSKVVVGCSPWFDSPAIASALKSIEAFSIVSSGEPTNRRSRAFSGNFPIELAQTYQFLDVDFAFKDWRKAKAIEYIIREKDENGSFQRLHSKFLVFLTRNDQGILNPTEFVIGSANFTQNSDRQHEVLCFVKSSKASDRLLLQWYQMLMIAAFQRNRKLLHFGESTAAVQNWNLEPDYIKYNLDAEAGLFEPEDYYNGKLAGHLVK